MSRLRPPCIVAFGGGGFSMEPDNPRLDDYLLSLTRVDTPEVCFVPTASGDDPGYVARFEQAFGAKRCVARTLHLFRRTVADLRELVLKQDLVYVGGGNTANLLAVWRAQGLDVVLREALEKGVVLAGVSAGAACWFEACVTDSLGPTLGPLRGGLGFLPGSFCPHYDGEPARRSQYETLVAGGFPGGFAVDDGAALRFERGRLVEGVVSGAGKRAFRVERERGRVRATELPTRVL